MDLKRSVWWLLIIGLTGCGEKDGREGTQLSTSPIF